MHVGVIATSPVKPLNVLVRNQSANAKGLAVHLLVKGVGLVAPPGPDENAVPAQPISLRALILRWGPLGGWADAVHLRWLYKLRFAANQSMDGDWRIQPK